MCDSNTRPFSLMENVKLWLRGKAGYTGCCWRSRCSRDNHAYKRGAISSTELLVAHRKRNKKQTKKQSQDGTEQTRMMKETKEKTITKKKGEKFAWRSEAAIRLHEEGYPV